jgi:hypothetical protein
MKRKTANIDIRVEPHIGRVAEVRRGYFSASVVLLADGQRIVGLDEEHESVEDSIAACDAVLDQALGTLEPLQARK